MHLVGFAERHANIAGERIIAGHAFVGAFENDDVLLAAQRIDNRRFGEGANDVDVDRAGFGVALVAQVIAGGFDVFRRATERDENGIGVFGLIFGNQMI